MSRERVAAPRRRCQHRLLMLLLLLLVRSGVTSASTSTWLRPSSNNSSGSGGSSACIIVHIANGLKRRIRQEISRAAKAVCCREITNICCCRGGAVGRGDVQSGYGGGGGIAAVGEG